MAGEEFLFAGISQAGSALGDGIEGYVKRKREKRVAESSFEAAVASLGAEDEQHGAEMLVSVLGDKLAKKIHNQKANAEDYLVAANAIQTYHQRNQENQQNAVRQAYMETQARAMEAQMAQSQAAADKQANFDSVLSKWVGQRNTYGPVDEGAMESEILAAGGPQALPALDAIRQYVRPDPPQPRFAHVNVAGGEEGESVVIDTKTGEPVPASHIQGAGGDSKLKDLSQTEVETIRQIDQAYEDLSALEELYAKEGMEHWGGPVSGRIRRALATLGFGDVATLAEADGLVTAAVPNLARGVFGEVGVLTNEDVERYTQLLPSSKDTADQRAAKIKTLRKKLESARLRQIEGLKKAGRNVSGFAESLPQRPGDESWRVTSSGVRYRPVTN